MRVGEHSLRGPCPHDQRLAGGRSRAADETNVPNCAANSLTIRSFDYASYRLPTQALRELKYQRRGGEIIQYLTPSGA